MTERDRLIFMLIETFDEQYNARQMITSQHTADHLLANGVIVPPCKVGDAVYVLFGEPSRTVKEFRVRTIVFGETNDSIGFTNKSMFTIWDKRWYDFFGKIIFTTREEAEKALEVKT